MKDFNDLIKITERLTDEDGCPWDKAQTHNSIRINLIEEAYEAVDAINRNNREDMIEELGDVLLQAVFHADIAKRNGEFDINDIIDRLCNKLISRHTHIFSDEKASNAQEALKNWENQKAKEKNHKSLNEQLNDIPKNFPSLLLAQKVIKKTGALPNNQQLIEIINNCNSKNAGQMLFLAVCLAFKAGIDPEVELLSYLHSFMAQNG